MKNKQYSNDSIRQKRQLDFIDSGEEYEVGNIGALPMPLLDLLQTDQNSLWVRKTIDSGLTSKIYKIEIDNITYTLKLKREKILVQNTDGQVSFLNELERRADFEKLKNEAAGDFQFETIVNTLYGSQKYGILLSRWIPGSHDITYTDEIFESIFETLFHMEISGIFEWDLCSGNMLLNNNKVYLYDFGYCYRFNPLIEYNSAGLEVPLFHAAERFETRSFMQHLLDMENREGRNQTLSLFKKEKQIALRWYIKKLDWLKQNRADQVVMNVTLDLINRWDTALTNPGLLDDCYMAESHRSYILDLNDDLHGKSCTRHTIEKVDRIIENITTSFKRLINLNALFFGDENMTRKELLTKYSKNRKLALKYQLKKD